MSNYSIQVISYRPSVRSSLSSSCVAVAVTTHTGQQHYVEAEHGSSKNDKTIALMVGTSERQATYRSKACDNHQEAANL
jgi:hypothetical protein